MHGTLDFGIKNKVAIVAGGGAFGKDIGNGRAASILLACRCWRKSNRC